MGIIIKQSIKGSIWSYLGVGIGFVTTAYLFPKFLSTDTIGLFSLLMAYSLLFAQFTSLGFHGVTARLFTYFRNKEKGHNGYFFLAFFVMIFGFTLFTLIYYTIKPVLIESNIEKSKLFADYIYLLLPLTFFTLLFIQLDIFNKVLYDAVFGTFLQEFVQRFSIFGITLLFIFQILSLHQLILAYAIVVSLKGFIIFVFLLIKGEISFMPRLGFIDKKLRNEIASVALFSILTGLGGSFVFNIDKIIINQQLGLGQTGIYTIAFFFGTLVIIPSRPLLRISGTLIADAFKRNDLAYIFDIYKRSCLNQLIVGALLFGGIWINIENILEILGPEYVSVKWVIFFIGLTNLFDMATGANGHIIALSPYYKVALVFIIILVLFVVGTMYWLIPIYGISGGALAIALSIFANNVIRFIFLRVKYKMQPFNYKFLIVVLSLVIAYIVSFIIPKMDLVIDIIIRSSVITIVYCLLILILKVSNDVNEIYKSIIKRIIK